ncbi:hypothetical protein [Brevibacillus nitrificans]|uniref:hypothetical protein n=1 Tax=Brevibacillus nitrificans TaxID=651560 RepID=UPI002858366C|nr:hypothetical protein [Brevibacillus nitrificans]MDR7317036.1 hypothetical protein [Brevibacillus nitrificans]
MITTRSPCTYPAMGNHEDDPEAFGKAFPHLPNEQAPGYGRTAYSFDDGNARFITLNTDHEDEDGNYVISLTSRRARG